jgi:hypothetical protein
MQDFIVLGIIPGTSIQITFNFWMYIGISLLTVQGMRALWRRRYAIRAYIAAVLISRIIARYQILA